MLFFSDNVIYDYDDMEFDDYYSSPPSIRLVNTGDNSMIMLQLVDLTRL